MRVANIGNELIVALLAAVSLVFAAVFAVLLSTSTAPRPTVFPLETAEQVATFTLTATFVQQNGTPEATPLAVGTRVPATTQSPVAVTTGVTATAPRDFAITSTDVAEFDATGGHSNVNASSDRAC